MMSGPVPAASATVSFWFMSVDEAMVGLTVTLGWSFL